MRSLNLDQLRTFVEVVESGSFSAAARRLNMTQPAASLQVRGLEERFGVTLIERAGKTALASAPGLELIAHARAIFLECDRAASAMRRFKEGWTARIRIGATLTAVTYDLPPILRLLRTQRPEIELIVTNMSSRDAADRVIANELDFGVVTLPLKNPRLRVTELRPENLVAIFPAGAGDAPKQVTPDFVAKQMLILEHDRGAVFARVAQWLAKAGAAPHSPMRIATVEGIKRVVAAGVGMSIIPEIAAREAGRDLIVRPLKPAAPLALGLIERRTQARNTSLDFARKALLQIGSGARR